MDHLLAIKRVANYRALQAWAPPSNLLEFRKYSIIFGVNGTGKSTIASLLSTAPADQEGRHGLEVIVGNEDARRIITDPHDPFWQSLRVFNSEYVKANLRFEDAPGGSAEPLLVLGAQRIGVEEERAAATERLAAIATELPAQEDAQRDAARSRDRLATDTARTICEELQGVAAKYAPRSYRAPQVRQLIEGGIAIDETIDVARELRTARTDTLPRLTAPSTRSFICEELVGAVRTVLNEQALSAVIQELVDDPASSRWVQEGLELHDGRALCLFCGSEVTDARRHALNNHFDESLKRLQHRLGELEDQVKALRERSVQTMQSLPTAEQLTESLRKEYSIAFEAAGASHTRFVEGLDVLLADIDSKREAMFSPITPNATPISTTLTFDDAIRVLEEHNSYVDDIQNHRQKAADRVEHARVAAKAHEYRDLDESEKSHAKTVQELKNERAELEKALRRTEVAELDPLPMADRLNEDLSHLLGRDDLSFAADSPGYRIMRGGVPASHLSEGERNAISLLYFLRSLEGHGTDRENCVVVIDDPVSSLDDNSLVGASALLWARLVTHCGQLIMFTHNFELFRTWSYQLNGAQSEIGRKSFALYEMRSTVAATGTGDYRRVPTLRDWPYEFHMQKRLRSEYHYLFWTVLRTLHECAEAPTPEKELEAAALLPNTCRRLLEAFLAFRHPAGVGSLSDQIRKIKPGTVPDETRTRVLRFVHMYSHHEEADVSRPLLRPETLENVRAVMDFMHAIDSEHFQDMCVALEIGYQPHGSAVESHADTAA